MGLREAFASVIASPATLLPVLREDPEEVRTRFGLSEAEPAVLAGVDADSYAFMAEESGAKRKAHLAVGIPRTVEALTEHHPELLEAFLGATTLAEDADDPMGVVRACADFLDFAALPRPLADFGSFELEQYRLLNDSVAAEACRPGPAAPPAHAEAAKGPVVLSPAVRVATYEHDVTDPGPRGSCPRRR
ncbi:hypothetical protein AB0M92_24120 [Streptomyces sp. NPDC051582]|uniref:hypothetical protein n=1 Tax=Streptomyces sp. NPDC051582 TaxID=3155167 RepID=UPI003414EC58